MEKLSPHRVLALDSNRLQVYVPMALCDAWCSATGSSHVVGEGSALEMASAKGTAYLIMVLAHTYGLALRLSKTTPLAVTHAEAEPASTARCRRCGPSVPRTLRAWDVRMNRGPRGSAEEPPGSPIGSVPGVADQIMALVRAAGMSTEMRLDPSR